MANASRAPFYAPRPGDDIYWFRGPIANGAVRLTTTQVKFYGQPGQAPTKRWAPFYTLDDPAVWSGSPLASDTIHPLLTAAGRVKPWRWLFGQDDASFWMGSPLASDIIHPLLTAVGQARSREWLFGLDDPSPWSPWTNRDLPILQVTVAPPFFNQLFRYPNEEPGWTGHRNWISVALTAGASQTLSSSQWRFLRVIAPDDVVPWQYTYQRSTLTPNTFGINLRWGFNFADDPSSWSPTTIRNQPALTPSGTPFTPTQWRFGTPVDEPWQSQTPSKPTTLVVVSSPFTPRQWPFALSTDEPWQQQTPRAQPLSTLAFTPFSPRFIPTLDEPPGWTSAFRPVSLTLTAAGPSPFAPTQWHFSSGFGNDDAGVWNAQSRNAFFTQTQPFSFVSAMWNLNIPQDTPMPISSLPSTILYMPAPSGVTLIQRTLTGVGL